MTPPLSPRNFHLLMATLTETSWFGDASQPHSNLTRHSNVLLEIGVKRVKLHRVPQTLFLSYRLRGAHYIILVDGRPRVLWLGGTGTPVRGC